MNAKQWLYTVFFLMSILSISAFAKERENYLYTSSDDIEKLYPLLTRQDITGVQIVYNWKQLEVAPGKYDFSMIEKDLTLLRKINKKMFLQIQDRFFEPQARYIPQYLLDDPQYAGGLVEQQDNPGEGKSQAMGWVAVQWNDALRTRYQKLISALAQTFDGRIEGINLPETAIDIDIKHDKTGFSCDKYYAATLDNLKFTRSVFKKSHVVQYVNFWPCEWDNDHKYMSRLFQFAKDNNIGLGGPDIVPHKKAQMHNSYPYFNRYKNKLPLVAMAVQEPTLTYINPVTHKKFSREEFVDFAENYLGADIIFWSVDSPWLSGKN
ncbi:hypothetical protein DDT52_20790 [Brenneria roseae subsp. roseae]|uniref:hypothetical protein n=1 Tax=Brenneria roseae TaxID=1509241 RepID=UPI000D60DF30|nr:hypothetical protein [Brenneria roseae]PWC14584.1 hypothetical protein DDT52_20790 [Brenneria roseae subsp. roseae]